MDRLAFSYRQTEAHYLFKTFRKMKGQSYSKLNRQGDDEPKHIKRKQNIAGRWPVNGYSPKKDRRGRGASVERKKKRNRREKNGREERRKKGLKGRLLFMNRPKSSPALPGVLLNSLHNLAHMFWFCSFITLMRSLLTPFPSTLDMRCSGLSDSHLILLALSVLMFLSIYFIS